MSLVLSRSCEAVITAMTVFRITKPSHSGEVVFHLLSPFPSAFFLNKITFICVCENGGLQVSFSVC